jgi:F0F1-type ATP synthase membrane subunit b/b'
MTDRDPSFADERDQAPVNITDSEVILRRAHEMIATARTFPLSSSPMIDRDQMLELLEEATTRLPDELRQARWLLKERAEFLAKTRREADDILDAARAQAERMVQRTEVVKAAESRARSTVESAEAEARKMRRECEDYCDQRLASFEIVLDKVAKTVAAGRERLNSLGSTVVESDAEAAPEVGEDDPGFFDQDRG